MDNRKVEVVKVKIIANENDERTNIFVKYVQADSELGISTEVGYRINFGEVTDYLPAYIYDKVLSKGNLKDRTILVERKFMPRDEFLKLANRK